MILGVAPFMAKSPPKQKDRWEFCWSDPPKSASREINAGPKLVQQLAPPTSTAVHVERLLFTEKSVEIEVGWEILAIFDQNPIIIPTKTLGCPSMITHNMFFLDGIIMWSFIYISYGLSLQKWGCP